MRGYFSSITRKSYFSRRGFQYLSIDGSLLSESNSFQVLNIMKKSSILCVSCVLQPTSAIVFTKSNFLFGSSRNLRSLKNRTLVKRSVLKYYSIERVLKYCHKEFHVSSSPRSAFDNNGIS